MAIIMTEIDSQLVCLVKKNEKEKLKIEFI